MSLDWLWPVILTLALAIPPAVGHAYHLVLVINYVSALGLRKRPTDLIRDLVFTAFWLSSAFLLWQHLKDPWWRWPWPGRIYPLMCVVSGLVIMPICSWRIATRRRPGGISGTSQTLDVARELGQANLIGRGRHSWLLRVPGNQSFRLRLREWELALPNLPANLDGLSIMHISDLHFAPCFDRRFFEFVVSACLPWQADLVLITGDLVDHDDGVAWIEPLLGQLKGRLGKFVILGNHDHDHKPEATTHALAHAGFETLEGCWTALEVDQSTLAIGGTSQPWGPALDHRRQPSADFRILLSHSPDLLYQAEAWGIELMFAGHNHGGQIRFPLVGPVFMPSRYSRRFDRGFFRAGETLLYVSEGVAGKHPIRYGCIPEVGRFVLRAPSAARAEPASPAAR
jgi:predicted MPP superfamily phosphohydrolase